MNDSISNNSKIMVFVKKYLIVLIIVFIFLFSIIHSYAISLEKYDMRLTLCEEAYNKILPYSLVKSIIDSPPGGKLERGCSNIKAVLESNGIYQSDYYAAMFNKEALNMLGANPSGAAKLFDCAKSMSPVYQKAYLSQAAAAFYDFDFYKAAVNVISILYFNFLSPGVIFNSMNLALMALISFIFIQFVFLAALYLKYRRLIKHEAYELDIAAVNISISPYLSDKEKKVSAALGKNIIVCLLFVIFYCYFSTGFGKYLNFSVESDRYLKNPREFIVVNGIDSSSASFSRFDEILKRVFENEKVSLDFYFYFIFMSKSLSGDVQAASLLSKRLHHNSFLINKISNNRPVFLDDKDFYRAFFSPMRSNPLFMIAVLLNVLLIIVFMGIIRKAAIFINAAKADLCACSTISCPECRVQIGLCNRCLMPLKSQDANRNIMNVFYSYDANIIYYISMILPGFSFFYFSEFILAFFYSAVIINLIFYNAAYYAGMVSGGSPHPVLTLFVYAVYFIEYSFFMKTNHK